MCEVERFEFAHCGVAGCQGAICGVDVCERANFVNERCEFAKCEFARFDGAIYEVASREIAIFEIAIRGIDAGNVNERAGVATYRANMRFRERPGKTKHVSHDSSTTRGAV